MFLPILIREMETLKADAKANGAPFKIRAYDKVLQQLKTLPEPVRGMEDLLGLEGVGAGIKTRFEQILKDGFLQEAKEIQEAPPNPKQILQTVYGIGPKKAANLVEEGITSLSELRAAAKKNKKLLNAKQQIGPRYAEDLVQRIPKSEMDEHAALVIAAIKACCKKAQAAVVGSYRREAPDSGDIDVLVTSQALEEAGGIPRVVEELRARAPGYILESLAEGPHKFMGICKLREGLPARRIDILLTGPTEFPYALLYFTGSDKFNIKMRKHALTKGYSLNEHGLTPPPPAAEADNILTEMEIFRFLGFPYAEPKARQKF